MLVTSVEGDPKAPFSIASVKQGSIKYHFLSFCYNSSWD